MIADLMRHVKRVYYYYRRYLAGNENGFGVFVGAVCYTVYEECLIPKKGDIQSLREELGLRLNLIKIPFFCQQVVRNKAGKIGICFYAISFLCHALNSLV